MKYLEATTWIEMQISNYKVRYITTFASVDTFIERE